jgi:oligoribonuclease (3'-5' exoribonuclease)
MSEEDRLDPDKLVVWLDFETSGLDTDRDTVIEAGWTITNSSLTQKTPLRSRLCAFVPLPHPQFDPTPITPDSPEWYENVNEYVISMHARSGLAQEFDNTNHYRVLHSFDMLDRLILDDLFSVGWTGDDKIVLAGSGLAAFDRKILIAGRSRLQSVSHYRAMDVSVAYETVGIEVPKTLEQMQAVFAKWPAVSGVWRDDDSWLLPDDLDPLHRADTDVAASIMLARALRSRIAS